MTEGKIIETLTNNGYICYPIKERVVSTDVLLVHPDTIKAERENKRNTKYVFIISHTYANEWCDNFAVRKYKKLAKKYHSLVGW